MLEKVFTQLYEEGVLFFLDVGNYCISTAPLSTLSKREEFLKCFDQTIEKGYIYSHNTSLTSIMDELMEDSCTTITYGFDSDTDEKATNVGQLFIRILKDNGYIVDWTEQMSRTKKVPLIIDSEQLCFDYPQQPTEEPKLMEEVNGPAMVSSPTIGTAMVPSPPTSLTERLTYTCYKCGKVYKLKKAYLKHVDKCG